MTYFDPMKAKPSDIDFLMSVSNDPRWGAGEKFDGYRELLYLFTNHNELMSSGGHDHLPCVPQFNIVIPELSDTVVDSEGLAPTRRLEDNGTCFKSWAYPESAIAWQREHGQASLVIFDILRYKGLDTIDLTFEKRRVLLKIVVDKLIAAGMPVRMEQLVMTNKLAYYNQIISRTVAEGHEGIILKDMTATYRPGKRGREWLKVKRSEVAVYTIQGFLPSASTDKYADMIGSIAYGKAHEILGSSSGIDDDMRRDMTDNPHKYTGKLAFFECQEITDAGVMRHPRFIRMLTPKEATSYVQ